MTKYGYLAVLIGALFLPGCSRKTPTYPVSGTVTIDGKPIPDGSISFLDPQNALGPDGGTIKDGKYEFKAKPGLKKVEIRASRVGKYPPGQAGAMGEAEGPIEYIPERYRKNTELKAEVTATGPNQFEFQLKSE